MILSSALLQCRRRAAVSSKQIRETAGRRAQGRLLGTTCARRAGQPRRRNPARAQRRRESSSGLPTWLAPASIIREPRGGRCSCAVPQPRSAVRSMPGGTVCRQPVRTRKEAAPLRAIPAASIVAFSALVMVLLATGLASASALKVLLGRIRRALLGRPRRVLLGRIHGARLDRRGGRGGSRGGARGAIRGDRMPRLATDDLRKLGGSERYKLLIIACGVHLFPFDSVTVQPSCR